MRVRTQATHSMQDGHVLVGGITYTQPGLPRRSSTWMPFMPAAALEQFRHDAFVSRVQMLDDEQEGHAAARRNARKKLLQRLKSARQAPTADDGKLKCALARSAL